MKPMREREFGLLLKDKPAMALLAVAELDPAYIAVVAKSIDSTFSHTSNILSSLERSGLIASRPSGRIRYLSLTERGKGAAEALRLLMAAMSQDHAQWAKLERIASVIVSIDDSGGSPLKIGPLRRDLAKIIAGDNEELRDEASRLNAQIESLLLEMQAEARKNRLRAGGT
jgi:DNA-binding MarR family transcriptional regulator